MKNPFITLLAASALLSACSKQDPGSNTAQDPGTISWVNNSGNPYRLELNGSAVKDLSGGHYWDQQVDPAAYSWKVTQLSGYVLYPTVRSGTFAVYSGQKKVISFP